jgi:hypothetical protein
MPPLIVAGIIAALYFLTPKNRAKTTVPVVLPYGQNTFGSPVLASNSSPAIPPGPATNAPSTSSSGLPNTSVQTQSVTRNFVPQATSGNPFYPYQGVLQPAYVPTAVPSQSNGQKCSGNCGGCGGNNSSCSVSGARASNSGCLIPSRGSLFTKQTIPFFQQYAAQVSSTPGANPFATFQDFQSTIQNTAPPTDDVSPAVGATKPIIGLPSNAPMRGYTLVA